MSWAETIKAINSDFNKPLNEFIDEILDTKIRNHLYRSDDYCVLGSSTTKTIVSSEKSVTGEGTSNSQALLLGSFTIPDNVYDVTIKAKLKCSKSDSSYTNAVYAFYTEDVASKTHIAFASGGPKNTYTEYTVKIDVSKVIPGKTIQFYLLSSSSGVIYYCNSLKITYKPYNRVVTSEKYLIGSEKSVLFYKGTSNDEIQLSQLPRLDRCEFMHEYTENSTYLFKTAVVDGVEYLQSVKYFGVLKVRY